MGGDYFANPKGMTLLVR